MNKRNIPAMESSPIIVALDYADGASALRLVEQLEPSLCRLKVGKELFTREGPQFVRQLVDRKFDVFLDLKFHDIPNTTAKAVAAAADLGVWMVNVHASGGSRMMSAAAEQLSAMGSDTLLIAVTVLTSFSPEDLLEIGIACSASDQVSRLASLAYNAGLHGVVCSAVEAGDICRQFGDVFLRVTPGIRPANSASNDQVRIMTPAQAMTGGSSHLVIGRPITASVNPQASLLEIVREISED